MQAFRELDQASRTARTRPLIGLRRGSEQIFIDVPDLETEIVVATTDNPHGLHVEAGRLTALKLIERAELRLARQNDDEAIFEAGFRAGIEVGIFHTAISEPMIETALRTAIGKRRLERSGGQSDAKA